MKNGKLKIEKGIPVPPHANSGELTLALRSLQKGDSFVVPILKRTSLPQIAKRLKIKIVTRKISDTLVRVWRSE